MWGLQTLGRPAIGDWFASSKATPERDHHLVISFASRTNQRWFEG